MKFRVFRKRNFDFKLNKHELTLEKTFSTFASKLNSSSRKTPRNLNLVTTWLSWPKISSLVGQFIFFQRFFLSLIHMINAFDQFTCKQFVLDHFIIKFISSFNFIHAKLKLWYHQQTTLHFLYYQNQIINHL